MLYFFIICCHKPSWTRKSQKVYFLFNQSKLIYFKFIFHVSQTSLKLSFLCNCLFALKLSVPANMSCQGWYPKIHNKECNLKKYQSQQQCSTKISSSLLLCSTLVPSLTALTLSYSPEGSPALAVFIHKNNIITHNFLKLDFLITCLPVYCVYIGF